MLCSTNAWMPLFCDDSSLQASSQRIFNTKAKKGNWLFKLGAFIMIFKELMTEPNQSYDPMFNSLDDNCVVLVSSDGIHYRIHSSILRIASGFFHAMITLPQVSDRPDSVTLEEKSNVVGILLRMISGLEVAKWESYEVIEDVLEAANKYDMPGPIAVMRLMITSPQFLEDPLRLFVVATRFGWAEEAKLASRLTLTLAIYDEEHETILGRLSSRYLLKLLKLHQRRKDGFKGLIDNQDKFNAGNTDPHLCCGGVKDNVFWRSLKSAMAAEMNRRPKGDTLLGAQFEEWPEAEACWAARCKTCSVVFYDKATTMENIKD